MSYDSALWARILSRAFVRNPELSTDWIDAAVDEFAGRYTREEMPWNVQAAFDRGSFATLLGLRYCRESDTVHVTAVGDSLAVLLDGETVVDTFPLSEPSQFEEDPMLLSTAPAKNAFLADAATCEATRRTWWLGQYHAPTILCMTDALAAWFLTNVPATPSSVSALGRMKRRRDLFALVQTERASGNLKRDDSTLVVLRAGI
jgi:hypothetical protein